MESVKISILSKPIYVPKFLNASAIANETELWNGSSWTEVNNLNTARQDFDGVGTSTATIAFGGLVPSPAVSALTEDWDGISWVEVADLSTARRSLAGAGTATAGLCVGGTPPVSAATEEWSIGKTTKTVDTD